MNLSAMQLAELLNLSYGQTCQLLRTGKIKAVRHSKKQGYAISVQEALRWIDQNIQATKMKLERGNERIRQLENAREILLRMKNCSDSQIRR